MKHSMEAMTEQLLLFKDDDIQILHRRIAHQEDKIERMRKSYYARLGKNAKDIADLKVTIDLLVSCICKGSVTTELKSKQEYEVLI